MTQTIVVTEFLSLDGVMEAPNEWNIPYVDETLGADIQGELDRATALLYGRTTYDATPSASARARSEAVRRTSLERSQSTSLSDVRLGAAPFTPGLRGTRRHRWVRPAAGAWGPRCGRARRRSGWRLSSFRRAR